MVQELLLVLSTIVAVFYLYNRFKPVKKANATNCGKNNCGCESSTEVS